ncbi:MAG: YbaB/EbfC family nucleoid-associated protein [Acidimicrobiales bacterium]
MTDLTLPDPSDGDGPDSDLGGLAGVGGLDMGALLEQAMGMQQQLLEAQAQAAEAVVEGQAGGGVVKIEVTGGMEFRSITIAPEAVDPDDVELLQDLVLAALNDAMDGIGRLQQASMGGLDLGAMGGMLGLGGATDDDEGDFDDELDDDEHGLDDDLDADVDPGGDGTR